MGRIERAQIEARPNAAARQERKQDCGRGSHVRSVRSGRSATGSRRSRARPTWWAGRRRRATRSIRRRRALRAPRAWPRARCWRDRRAGRSRSRRAASRSRRPARTPRSERADCAAGQPRQRVRRERDHPEAHRAECDRQDPLLEAPAGRRLPARRALARRRRRRRGRGRGGVCGGERPASRALRLANRGPDRVLEPGRADLAAGRVRARLVEDEADGHALGRTAPQRDRGDHRHAELATDVERAVDRRAAREPRRRDAQRHVRLRHQAHSVGLERRAGDRASLARALRHPVPAEPEDDGVGPQVFLRMKHRGRREQKERDDRGAWSRRKHRAKLACTPWSVQRRARA